MAVVISTLGLFVVGVPGFFAELQEACAGATCDRWLLSPEQARGLEASGLSLGFYAVYKIALEAIFVLSFCVMATVIYWRRSNDRMALFAAITLVTFGGNAFIDTKHALAEGSTVWFWPVTFMDFLGSTVLFVFFYLFPDGRFVPRWTRWAALGWLALNVVGYFSPRCVFLNEQSLAFPVFALAFFLSVIGAQVYRYRRVSGTVQRQQTKWVVSGFAAAMAGLFVTALGEVLLRDSLAAGAYGGVLEMIGLTGFYAFVLLIPLSIGFAILRHRLYDIDLLINRGLVYGSLTILLAATYFGGVVGLQSVLRLLAGQESTLAVVASTLAIAALFSPLRRRIQGFIDRRFYRKKYDAQETLGAFSIRLREEPDLEALSADLVAVVRETMQPSSVSLLLRPPHEASGVRQRSGPDG